MTILEPVATARVHRPGRDDAPWWMLVDPLLVLSALAIAAMGVVLVYSATRGVAGDYTDPDTTYLQRQAMFAVFGAIVGIVAALISPNVIRRLWPLGYVAALASLVLVAMIGVEVSGTRGWFSFGELRFQPSEPAKVALIVALAVVLSPPRNAEVGLGRLGTALMLAGAPIALVLLQPDLGTVLVYLAVAFVVIVAAGVRTRWIVLLALLAATTAVGVLRSDLLEDYQQARLTVFLFAPEQVSEQAAAYAYNAEQAQIAIGNGGLTGQGLFNGTQTRSRLVPAQQTDFIFTVAGEELGLRGAGVLLGLYALLLLRIWRIASTVPSSFGRLLCMGVFSMFLFQMFQAVGMTMGMMPVTGIPLPLVSYGGSSMITSMAALGLVAGVYRRRFVID